LKHYHRKAIEVMVRDGVANITKLEFLGGLIQGDFLLLMQVDARPNSTRPMRPKSVYTSK
jgi:hypothetical protein